MSATADVVVVGGGIVGRCAALELARRGGAGVVVLDRGDRCAGTRRSAAVLRAASSDPVERDLARQGLEQFRRWPELTGTDGGIRWTGAAVVAAAADAGALTASSCVRTLCERDVAELLPWYRLPDGAAAFLDARAGTANPALVLAGLGSALRCHGVRWRPDAATGLLVRGGRVVGVGTATGAVPCGAALVAAGPWTTGLLATAGLDLPIVVTRTALLVLDGPPPGALPLVDLAAGVLVRPYGSRRWLVGTRRTAQHSLPLGGGGLGWGGTASWRTESRPTLDALRTVAPALGNARARSGWFGLYDVTPDQRPLVGPVPGLRGLHVAAGFSGGGFKLAPAAARLAAHALLGAPPTPLHAVLSPARFSRSAA